MSKKDKPTIYIAGPLFNLGETLLNENLAEKLEEKGYKVYLPQRDGFEFSNLYNKLSDKIPESDIENAVYDIIYAFDLGYLIPNSDIIVARMDSPLDSGVDIELMYGNILEKYNLGYRTDSKSEFGNLTNDYGGAHTFPMNCLDRLILQSSDSNKSAKKFDELVDVIDNDIMKNYYKKNICHSQDFLNEVPKLNNTFLTGKMLFKYVDDLSKIQTEKGLTSIVDRYVKLKDKLPKISPKLTRI